MKLIEPGSGVDDMGGGIAWGCIKWVAIIITAIYIILLLFCSCTTVKRTAWAARYEDNNVVVLTAEGDKIILPAKEKGSIGDKYIIRVKFKKVKK